jgi:hypothetical protein
MRKEAVAVHKTVCIFQGAVYLKISGLPPECAIAEIEATGASVSSVDANHAEAILSLSEDPVAFARVLVANGWEWG